MEYTDQQLLTLFKSPETREEAFTALVRRYQEKLYWHIRRMVIDHDDAHDLLQNVFIKVWHHLSDFREESQLYTWLYRIATNECLSFLEQQKKKRAISLSDVENSLENKLKAEMHFDASKLEWKLQQAYTEITGKTADCLSFAVL